MIRVFVSGVVGGLLMFLVGAATHMALNAESRHIRRVDDEAAMAGMFTSQELSAGMYGFPLPKEGFEQLPPDESLAEYNRVNELFKEGPAGYLIVAPRGQDMMGPRELVGEFASNVIAALFVSFVVFSLSSRLGYGLRWTVVILIGLSGWLTLLVSYGLWYRFPMAFLIDGLWSSMAEWAVAGLAIAAIARPPKQGPQEG